MKPIAAIDRHGNRAVVIGFTGAYYGSVVAVLCDRTGKVWHELVEEIKILPNEDFPVNWLDWKIDNPEAN